MFTIKTSAENKTNVIKASVKLHNFGFSQLKKSKSLSSRKQNKIKGEHYNFDHLNR